MKLNPYLNFNGNCEEAMIFYKTALNGQFLGTGIMHYGDAPGSDKMPENVKKLVIHSALKIGNDILMGADSSAISPVELTTGNNVHLSLSPETLEEAERVYKTLAEGGKEIVSFGKQFFGYHGSLVDKFGIFWMVTYEGK